MLFCTTSSLILTYSHKQLDTYSHKQQELRDILQVLRKITPRSSILISEEASKLCGIALENAVTYMNSIHSLINSRDAEPLNRAFDESVFYHMLSQVHLMRPWDVGACDFCRISNKRLSVLYQSMKTYLASMSWLISIEESLIEEPGNRRFMRSRHFTRSAYIVDCVRVASLQNVQNTVSFTYGPDHRRFLQSYVTQEFRDLVAIHSLCPPSRTPRGLNWATFSMQATEIDFPANLYSTKITIKHASTFLPFHLLFSLCISFLSAIVYMII